MGGNTQKVSRIKTIISNCKQIRENGVGNIKNKLKLDYFLLLLIPLFVGILVIFNLSYGLVLFLVMLFVILLLKKNWLIYAIILSLFLEAHVFSFYLVGARIRAVQILEIIALIYLLTAILMGKIVLKKMPLSSFLWLYILVNFIAIINSVSFARGLKISILLLGLGLLYYVIINLITERKIFNKAFNLLLYVGVAEILYGLYQVFAGMCNYYLSINLPIGHRGMTHAEFIGSPWGRPYGTFVEPDWFGAICMFYALLFIALYFSKLKHNKRFYLFGIMISTMGLFLGFVRASWIGFLIGLLALLVFSKKIRLSRLKIFLFSKISLGSILVILLLTFVFPIINEIIKSRFITKTPITLSDVRLVKSIHALRLFLEHPIIGNGPGSFGIQGIWGDSEEYYEKLVAEGKLSPEGRFDTNIITTVLADTGIVGFFFFILISITFLRYNLRAIPMINNDYQIISVGFFGGIIGLFISYIFTTGFWMSFTWVFVGFNIASIKVGLMSNKDRT